MHDLQAIIQLPCLNLLLALISFFIWKKYRLLARTLLTISFTSLWLLSTPVVANKLIDSLEKQYPPLKSEKTQNNNSAAIVVLGGGIQSAPEFDNQYSGSEATLHRLYYASFLFQKTHFPIIVSGGNPSQTTTTEADTMSIILKNSFRVPTLLIENQSLNTVDESRLLLPILKQHKIETIYLITNAWHMPRTMYIFNSTFKNSGITIIPAPIGKNSSFNHVSLMNYLPSLDGLNKSNIAIHEYLGIIWYSIRHQL